MVDGLDPSEIGLPVDSQTVGEGIPLARPVTQELDTPPASHADDFLLLSSMRRQVWSDLGLLVVLVVAAELLAVLVVGIALALPDSPPEQLESELERSLLFPMLAVRALIVVAAVGAVLCLRGQSLRSVGVGQRALALNGVIGIGTLGVAYGLIFMWQFASFFCWPGLLDQMSENTERILALVPRRHPLGYVPIALLIGVYEELLFRGFILTRLRRGTGSWTAAVLISTVVFTSLHAFDQTAAALGPITILSLVFSAATIWRRSIVPAIVAHALFDLSQFIGLYYLKGGSWA